MKYLFDIFVKIKSTDLVLEIKHGGFNNSKYELAMQRADRRTAVSRIHCTCQDDRLLHRGRLPELLSIWTRR